MNPQNLINIFGGASNLIVLAVSTLTKGKVAPTAENIDVAAVRMLSIPQDDVKKACKALHITDQTTIDHAIGLFQKAGQANGNALAYIAEKAAHITHIGGDE